MEQAKAWFGKQNDLQKKIVLAALIIGGLMILFPPKVVTNTNPLINQTQTQAAGYHFLLDDPAAEQKSAARAMLGDDVDKLIGSGIEWGKLLVQLAIVGGAAYFLLRYTQRNPSGALS